MKTAKKCLFIRQLENGSWVRCTRDRTVVHDHPCSADGLRKAVAKGLNYTFVHQVQP
jgi:hypothetical protein